MTTDEAREIVDRLPTRYREAVDALLNPEPGGPSSCPLGGDHLTVLLGTGGHCLRCGAFMGVASIALDDLDWEEWRRVFDQTKVAIAEALERKPLPGLHGPTVAEWLAQTVAYAAVEA